MKVLELLTIFNKKPSFKIKNSSYLLAHNGVVLPKIVVKANSLNHETYKLLRYFKTPQYEKIYLLRRAKGFNTLLFNVNYDILVCNRNFTIIDSLVDVAPGYISEYYQLGHFVYYAPVGTIRYYSLKINDQLRIERDWLF